jgi:nucleotide-binding universal stress UspA family protein
VIAHVVTTPTPAQEIAAPVWIPDALERGRGAAAPSQSIDVAERVVAEARTLAAELGADARPVIRTGLFAPDVLLDLAREEEVDLVVLAANLRQLFRTLKRGCRRDAARARVPEIPPVAAGPRAPSCDVL